MLWEEKEEKRRILISSKSGVKEGSEGGLK
jgi:hypothetical protein